MRCVTLGRSLPPASISPIHKMEIIFQAQPASGPAEGGLASRKSCVSLEMAFREDGLGQCSEQVQPLCFVGVLVTRP